MEYGELSTESELPNYPALNRCMLIESRHGARVEVVKALRASLLFTEIIEPSSLAEGVERLSREEFDACIVGTSVSRAKSEEFLKLAVEKSCSKDCAFITLVADADEAVIMLDSAALMHNSVHWPCSKKSFSDGVVLAVVKANQSSPWASVFKQSALMKSAEMEAAEAINGLGDTIFQLEISALNSLFSDGSGDLWEIIRGAESGEYRLDAERQPMENTRQALDRVSEKLFGKVKTPKVLAFKAYFRDSLTIWFVDLVTYSAAAATNNLRKGLLSYVASLH